MAGWDQVLIPTFISYILLAIPGVMMEVYCYYVRGGMVQHDTSRDETFMPFYEASRETMIYSKRFCDRPTINGKKNKKKNANGEETEAVAVPGINPSANLGTSNTSAIETNVKAEGDEGKERSSDASKAFYAFLDWSCGTQDKGIVIHRRNLSRAAGDSSKLAPHLYGPFVFLYPTKQWLRGDDAACYGYPQWGKGGEARARAEFKAAKDKGFNRYWHYNIIRRIRREKEKGIEVQLHTSPMLQ